MLRKVRGGAGRGMVPGSGGGRSVNIYVYMLRNSVAAPGGGHRRLQQETGDRAPRLLAPQPLGSALELETKVHTKVRNIRDGPY